MKVFLDTNVLLYLFDDTDSNHLQTALLLEKLLRSQAIILISHNVLEEYIHSHLQLAKLTGMKHRVEKLLGNLDKIARIPQLSMIGPPPHIEFTKRVVKVMEDNKIQSNDAYILTLLAENKPITLFTFDQKLNRAAIKLGLITIP